MGPRRGARKIPITDRLEEVLAALQWGRAGGRGKSRDYTLMSVLPKRLQWGRAGGRGKSSR